MNQLNMYVYRFMFGELVGEAHVIKCDNLKSGHMLAQSYIDERKDIDMSQGMQDVTYHITHE